MKKRLLINCCERRGEERRGEETWREVGKSCDCVSVVV